jgi:hypothetical protein
LFNAPPINPLSPALPEVLGISGAEYVLHQLQTKRRAKAKTLRLVSPNDKLAPGLAGQTQQALRRYAEYRVDEQQALAQETRRHGWRLAIVAIFLLAFFLALSQIFAATKRLCYGTDLRPLAGARLIIAHPEPPMNELRSRATISG